MKQNFYYRSASDANEKLDYVWKEIWKINNLKGDEIYLLKIDGVLMEEITKCNHWVVTSFKANFQ